MNVLSRWDQFEICSMFQGEKFIFLFLIFFSVVSIFQDKKDKRKKQNKKPNSRQIFMHEHYEPSVNYLWLNVGMWKVGYEADP